jgi:hypothetical protein
LYFVLENGDIGCLLLQPFQRWYLSRAAGRHLIRRVARLLCTFYANHDIKTKLHRAAYGRVTLLCGVRRETLSEKRQKATKPAVNQHCIRQSNNKKCQRRRESEEEAVVTTWMIMVTDTLDGRGAALVSRHGRTRWIVVKTRMVVLYLEDRLSMDLYSCGYPDPPCGEWLVRIKQIILSIYVKKKKNTSRM